MISQGKEEMGKMRKRTDGSAEETPKRGDGEHKERNRSDFHMRHGAAWGHRRAPGTCPWSSWSMGFGNQPHCSKRARNEPQKDAAPPEARGSAELRAKPPPSDTHPPSTSLVSHPRALAAQGPLEKSLWHCRKNPDSTRRK